MASLGHFATALSAASPVPDQPPDGDVFQSLGSAGSFAVVTAGEILLIEGSHFTSMVSSQAEEHPTLEPVLIFLLLDFRFRTCSVLRESPFSILSGRRLTF